MDVTPRNGAAADPEIGRQRKRTASEPHDEHRDPDPSPEPPGDDDDEHIGREERRPAEGEVLRDQRPGSARRSAIARRRRSPARTTAASQHHGRHDELRRHGVRRRDVPASRGTKSFQNPTHANGPFETDPGAAYSMRHDERRHDRRPRRRPRARADRPVPGRPRRGDEDDDRRQHVADPRLARRATGSPGRTRGTCGRRPAPSLPAAAGPARSPVRAASGTGQRRPGSMTPRASGRTMSSRGAMDGPGCPARRRPMSPRSTTSPDRGVTIATSPTATTHSR